MAEDKEPELLILPKSKSFFDQLIEGRGEADAQLAAKLLPLMRQYPELKQHLGQVEALLRMRGEGAWLMTPHRIDIR